MQLFTEGGVTYTTEGREIYDELQNRCLEIASKLDNPREIQLIATDAGSMAALLESFDRNVRKMREEANNVQD